MGEIICVVGPTATGKTGLAVALAKRLGGEVLSCDSMQVYRGMVIGSAAPTAAELDGVVHHMIGVVDPRENFSVSRYVEMADPILQDILARGKTAIVTGGTGLYCDSLIAGRTFAPQPSTGRREALERLASERGIDAVLELLRAVDPESAARLHPSDRKRIIRAVEVYQETGRTMTQQNAETAALPPKYHARWIGLDYADRQALYARIDLRAQRMFEGGLLGEIRALLAAGVPETATAMQAIGYKEPLAALRGEITMAEALEQVQRESRRYAKRQRTWFRRRAETVWIEQPVADVLAAAMAALA